MKNHFSLLLYIQQSNLVSPSRRPHVKTTFDVLKVSSYMRAWVSGIKWGPLTNLFLSPMQKQTSGS